MKTTTSNIFSSIKQYTSSMTIAGNSAEQAASFSPVYTNRQIRFAVAAFFFCQGICFASWASRIPDIKMSLHLTDGALGSILLALPAGQLTAMPFPGGLSPGLAAGRSCVSVSFSMQFA